jgi:hypothetical protein
MVSKRHLWLLYATFLFVPFFVVGGGTFLDGQFIGLMLAVALGIALLVTDRWLRGALTYFLIWQTVLSLMTVVSMPAHSYRIVGMEMLLITTFMTAVWLFFAHTDVKEESVYNIICIAVLIQAIIAWAQIKTGHDPIGRFLYTVFSVPVAYYMGEGAGTGTLLNTNFLACTIVIATPFFLRRWWALGLLITLPLLIPLQTATAVIALGVGLPVFFSQRKLFNKFPIWPIILIIGISLSMWYMIQYKGGLSQVFSVEGSLGAESRLYIWLKVWIYMKKSFFLLLIGASSGATPEFNLHNDYMTVFLKFGFVGVVFVAGYIKNLYRGDKRLYSVMVIALVTMMGSISMQLPISMLIITTTAGLLERKKLHGT